MKAWDEVGVFAREVALYERLRDRGVTVSFITYGNSEDLEYSGRLRKINILCNRWGLSDGNYQRFLHLIHAKPLMSCDLIKTNQMNGADIALRAAKFWKKPIIARCGYMWSFNEAKERGYDSIEAHNVRDLEAKVFDQADRSVVTTQTMLEDIVSRIPNISERARVIPNFVDDSIFCSLGNVQKRYDIIFVGRLSREKNIEALLRAVKDIDTKVLVIGKGPLQDLVINSSDSINGTIEWKKRVSNSELPNYFNASQLFVFPSLYENHPKALIEAMSCGIPVIGADSPGIREIIHHRDNGFLCGTDSESISSAIENLLANPDLCKNLGRNARKYAVENFSLNGIFEMEYQLYNELLSERKF